MVKFVYKYFWWIVVLVLLIVGWASWFYIVKQIAKNVVKETRVETKVPSEFMGAVFKEYVKGDVTWEIKAKRVIADGSLYRLTDVEAKLNCGNKILKLYADNAVYDKVNGKIELFGNVQGGLK